MKIEKDKPESEKVLEIKEGRNYVRIQIRKADIHLIGKILDIFDETKKGEELSGGKKMIDKLKQFIENSDKRVKKINEDIKRIEKREKKAYDELDKLV